MLSIRPLYAKYCSLSTWGSTSTVRDAKLYIRWPYSLGRNTDFQLFILLPFWNLAWISEVLVAMKHPVVNLFQWSMDFEQFASLLNIKPLLSICKNRFTDVISVFIISKVLSSEIKCDGFSFLMFSVLSQIEAFIL